MNLLYVSPRLPYPLNNGSSIRINQLARGISAHHNVTILCLASDHNQIENAQSFFKNINIDLRVVNKEVTCENRSHPSLFGFRKLNAKRILQIKSLFSKFPYEYYKYYTDNFQAAITSILSTHQFDAIIVAQSQMGYYDFKNGNAPLILDQHNVEYQLIKRTGNHSNDLLRKIFAICEHKKYKTHEINCCNKFDAFVTCSQTDADTLTNDGVTTPYAVIPNGVDTDYFVSNSNQRNAINENPSILFVGTISYHPNQDAIKYFISQILPAVRLSTPNVSFTIVGHGPPESIKEYSRKDDNILVTGAVDDLRPFYDTATVVIVPLRIGGGTRLKIVEAQAMGKAIVSTDVGAEGINVTDGENILLRNTPKEFANAVTDCLQSRDLREKIGSAAQCLAHKHYSWSSIADSFSRFIETNVKIKIDKTNG